KTFRNRRLDRGSTLGDLAERCERKGSPRPSDSNQSVLERGIHAPRPALRAALCQLHALRIDYLGRGDRDASAPPCSARRGGACAPSRPPSGRATSAEKSPPTASGPA